jgi:hypothetical protein
LLASGCQSGIKTALQFVTKLLTACRQRGTIPRMAASGTTITRGKTLLASTESTSVDTVESLPLPWPSAGISAREARRPHGHRCVICSEEYRCAGPDSSGECAPLCGPCLWVELGTQARMYQSIADSIDRRRRKLEQQVGRSKCRKAQTHRRSRLRAGNLVAGFGRVMLKRAAHGADNSGNRAALEFLQVDSSSEGI